MKYTSEVEPIGELMAQQTEEVIWIKGRKTDTIIQNKLVRIGCKC